MLVIDKEEGDQPGSINQETVFPVFCFFSAFMVIIFKLPVSLVLPLRHRFPGTCGSWTASKCGATRFKSYLAVASGV